MAFRRRRHCRELWICAFDYCECFALPFIVSENRFAEQMPMYSYLDRPIASLDEGGKVLVWAMRRWVVAVEKRTCPVAALGMALSERGLMPALAPFHRVMGLLATHARQDLPFSPFCSPHVSEGEAVLLAVISNCRGPRAHTLETTLFLLVGEEGRASMHDAILQLGEALDRAGMLPAVPAPLATVWVNG